MSETCRAPEEETSWFPKPVDVSRTRRDSTLEYLTHPANVIYLDILIFLLTTPLLIIPSALKSVFVFVSGPVVAFTKSEHLINIASTRCELQCHHTSPSLCMYILDLCANKIKGDKLSAVTTAF